MEKHPIKIKSQARPRDDRETRDLWPIFFRALVRARELKNVKRACEETGLSRSTFYFLRERFKTYGTSSDALVRESRRHNAIPDSVVREIFELTRRYPSYSCTKLASLLNARGRKVSATTIRNYWRKRRLNTKADRLLWVHSEALEGRATLSAAHLRMLKQISLKGP